MDNTILGILAGVQLAIFILIWIYSSLTYLVLKKKSIFWINVMASAFILLSIEEFWNTLTMQMSENSLFNSFLTVIIGISLIMFLREMIKNVKEYK